MNARENREPTLEPSHEMKERIFDRIDRVRFNWNWTQGHMLSMVQDWREAFQVMRFNTLYHAMTLPARELNGDIDHCRETSDDAAIEKQRQWEERMKEHFPNVIGRTEQFQQDLAYWDRLTEIYAEEMELAEAMAVEARERVILRANQEFGNVMDNELAKALRANTPQDYLSELDWN